MSWNEVFSLRANNANVRANGMRGVDSINYIHVADLWTGDTGIRDPIKNTATGGSYAN